MTNTPSLPHRSCLYMPASNERALEKAKTLAADTIIFDLEDAVSPEAKNQARSNACAAVSSNEYGDRELVVRLNAVDTEWFQADMESICANAPDAILIPKVCTAEDVQDLSVRMDIAGAHAKTALWVMIEMPLAVLNVAKIAEVAEDTRLSAFVMGFNDLAKEMRADQDRNLFLPAMAQTIMAARAYGLDAIDSVYNDFRDADGLAVECKQAQKYGFDGKSLIHPSQIEVANAAFAPSPEKIAEAETIITAFAKAENAGKGVITVNGKMTELLHLQQAERVVALADAISQIKTDF